MSLNLSMITATTSCCDSDAVKQTDTPSLLALFEIMNICTAKVEILTNLFTDYFFQLVQIPALLQTSGRNHVG